jgi:hypothetical protein
MHFCEATYGPPCILKVRKCVAYVRDKGAAVEIKSFLGEYTETVA